MNNGPRTHNQSSAERHSTHKKKKAGKQKKPFFWLRMLAVLLGIVIFGEVLYCFLVFTNIPLIVQLRNIYIETAISTTTHDWLAEKFLPKYMVDDVKYQMAVRVAEQDEWNSRRDPVATTEAPATSQQASDISDSTAEQGGEPTEVTETPTEDNVFDEEEFFALYWELSKSSFNAYLEDHPDVIKDGWDKIYINEAGLNDKGTEIYTSMGEQVLAIDVPNQLLLVRVTGSGYQGVLAIGKDPSQLRCCVASTIGKSGQKLAKIVNANEGVIGMTASGFKDSGGTGNGGTILGYAICEGKEYSAHITRSGYKRLELTVDNKMYIASSNSKVPSDVTDCMEFSPAMIIDGEMYTKGFSFWSSINPRACIGQSSTGEILMLVIEGRMVGRSIGTTVQTCAEIMMRHDGYVAMNVDGGASAVMYYNGEYVTKCSNGSDSRNMPNAWVYGNYDK